MKDTLHSEEQTGVSQARKKMYNSTQFASPAQGFIPNSDQWLQDPYQAAYRSPMIPSASPKVSSDNPLVSKDEPMDAVQSNLITPMTPTAFQVGSPPTLLPQQAAAPSRCQPSTPWTPSSSLQESNTFRASTPSPKNPVQAGHFSPMTPTPSQAGGPPTLPQQVATSNMQDSRMFPTSTPSSKDSVRHFYLPLKDSIPLQLGSLPSPAQKIAAPSTYQASTPRTCRSNVQDSQMFPASTPSPNDPVQSVPLSPMSSTPSQAGSPLTLPQLAAAPSSHQPSMPMGNVQDSQMFPASTPSAKETVQTVNFSPMTSSPSLGSPPTNPQLENASSSHQPLTARSNVQDSQMFQPATPATEPSTTTAGSAAPQLQNVVCSVNLGCKLDLKQIALKARNAEYNPKRFGAVIMRIREPRTTALIFSSGKMVCTGAKGEESARLAARKFARIVQKLDFPAKFMSFKIQNMVGSFDVGFPIRLEALQVCHGQFACYEPELFPGLVYRMVKPKIVILIFLSGKVVLTGAKSKNEIDDGFKNIYPILKSFMRKPVKTDEDDTEDEL